MLPNRYAHEVDTQLQTQTTNPDNQKPRKPCMVAHSSQDQGEVQGHAGWWADLACHAYTQRLEACQASRRATPDADNAMHPLNAASNADT